MAKNKTKKIIVAGSMVVEAVYPRIVKTDGCRARAAKRQLSSEAQQRMNRKYSWQKLELLLAANFGPGDLVVTLTYNDRWLPSDRKTAEARLKAFRSSLARIRKAKGQELVMFWNHEHKHGDGRWHHHCVINATGDDYELIRQCWRYGADIEITPLEVSRARNFESLARYMSKESGDRLGQRTWSYTRNARKPEVETFRVEDDTTVQIPRGALDLGTFSDSNQHGSARVIKYMAPGWDQRRRPRSRRRKPRS